MKSFFIKSVKISTVLAFMCSFYPLNAHAVTTPQVYCASLAAVSCEILNMEPNGTSDLIKYCRNQKLIMTMMSTAAILLISNNYTAITQPNGISCGSSSWMCLTSGTVCAGGTGTCACGAYCIGCSGIAPVCVWQTWGINNATLCSNLP